MLMIVYSSNHQPPDIAPLHSSLRDIPWNPIARRLTITPKKSKGVEVEGSTRVRPLRMRAVRSELIIYDITNN
jgi:hypothetical protein